MKPSGPIIYVSPEGRKDADGTAASPMTSIREAIDALPAGGGGTIVLASGTYTEQLSIGGAGAPLLITAAPEARVIFEGGQRISQWKPHPERKGVYVTKAPEREFLFGHTDYFDLWDEVARVRYGKVADAKAVEYWPGSTLLDGGEILLHPHDGESPDGLNLWINRRAAGVEIGRHHVTLRGIEFQNYLGGDQARAVTLLECRDVVIQGCIFRNCAIGVRSSAENVAITQCQFREVGTGVYQAGRGKAIMVRESVFEGAVGPFAFSDIDEHLSNGIRIYFYSDGATVEQCVTTGFWAGLYIKTISGDGGQLPYVVRNNTFLDGIRSGADCRQPRTEISRNIIGTPRTMEGAGKLASYYREMGATLHDNLFFGPDNPGKMDPFENLPGGDLSLKEPTAVGATTLTKVQWNTRTTKKLAKKAVSEEKMAFLEPLSVSASQAGAVFSLTLNHPAAIDFQYRKKGAGSWITAEGYDATAYPASSMIASIPFEPVVRTPFHWIVPLVSGELHPKETYEYQLVVKPDGDKPLDPQKGSFETKGKPRIFHVRADGENAKADGSKDRPFPTLQAAFDRVVPGDEIIVGAGLYTQPAIIRHGGSSGQGVMITGAGTQETIFDGGKRNGTLLEIVNAPNVTVRGIQFRWFGNYGVVVRKSPQFSMKECWIWNQSFTDTGACGIGLEISDSENSSIRQCLFNRLQSAVVVMRSPGLSFQQNTAFGNVYSGLDLIDSARNSVVTHNSLTFSGNRALYIVEHDRAAFDSLESDYNNYASRVRDIAPQRPENDFTPAARYGILTGQSKAIVAVTMGADYWRDFYTMQDWRAFSKKDKHTLFADPDYVDPLSKDLRPRSGSPNSLADGSVIGALPVAGTSRSE